MKFNFESTFQNMNSKIVHSDSVRKVLFSPNSKFIGTMSDTDSLKIWDIERRECIRTLRSKTFTNSYICFKGRGKCLSFSTDGCFMATGDSNGIVKIWDTNTWKSLFDLKNEEYKIWKVLFSPDGHFLVVGSGNAKINIWKLITREYIPLETNLDFIFNISFSNSKLMVSGHRNESFKLLEIDINSPNFEHRTYNFEYEPYVHGTTFSPDNQFMYSYSYGQNDIHIWKVATGKCVNVLQSQSTGHSFEIRDISISSDGKFLVTGSNDDTVKIWDIKNKKCICTLEGHSGGVLGVAFSPNGRFAVSGSYDFTAILWDLREYIPSKKLEFLIASSLNEKSYWIVQKLFDPILISDIFERL